MAYSTPTQIRSVDPYDSRASSAVNALTRIISNATNCILTFDSLEVTKASNTTLDVDAGRCIKDDVLIEVSAFSGVDMDDATYYISGGTPMDEDGYYYIVLQYTYSKMKPAPEAEILLIKPSQRSSLFDSTCLFLKAIYVTSSVIQSVHDYDPENTSNKRVFTALYEAADSIAITSTLTSRAGRVCLDSEGIKAWDAAGTPNQILNINETGGITIGYGSNNQITLASGIINLKSNSLEIIGSGNSGISLNNATGDAIHIITAGGDAIDIDNATSHGIKISNAGGEALHIVTAGDNAIEIENATRDGIQINNAGDHAIDIVTATTHGINILSAGNNAIQIENATTDAIHINHAGNNAIDIDNSTSHGISITTAGDNAIHIINSTSNAIDILNAGDDAIDINNATSNGINITTAGVNAILVQASTQYGISILGASCGYGPLYIQNAGTTNLNTKYPSAAIDTIAVDSNHNIAIKTAAGTWTTVGGGSYNLDVIPDGSTYGKVKLTNLTSNEVDHTKILNIGTNSHATIDSHISSNTVHGATGAVVGTTNSQSLVNKSLDTLNGSGKHIIIDRSNHTFSHYGYRWTGSGLYTELLAKFSDKANGASYILDLGATTAPSNPSIQTLTALRAQSYNTAIIATGVSGSGIYATSTNSNAIAAISTNGSSIAVDAGSASCQYLFYGASSYDVSKGALRLPPTSSSSAPTHSAASGAVWIASDHILYMNIDGSTTWKPFGPNAPLTIDTTGKSIQGINIDDTDSGYSGIRINDSGNYGVVVNNATKSAFNVSTSFTGEHGIEIQRAGSTSYDAIHIDTSQSRYGIYLNGSNSHGIYINDAGADGIHIKDCSSNGIEIEGSTSSGIWVYGVSNVGLRIDDDCGNGHITLIPTTTNPNTIYPGAIGGGICTYDTGSAVELWFHNGTNWFKVA